MDFDDYQRQVANTAIYPDAGTSNISALMYCAGSATGEAGEVWGQVKKAYRDEQGVISDGREKNIRKEIGDTLWYLAQLCNELCVSGSEVMKENLEKLARRAETGTLGGDGDDREKERHTVEVAGDGRWWLRHVNCLFEELACPYTLAASICQSRYAAPPGNFEALLDERGEFVFGERTNVGLARRGLLVPTHTPLPAPVAIASDNPQEYGWALTFTPQYGPLKEQQITRTFWFQDLETARYSCYSRYGEGTIISEGYRTDGKEAFTGEGRIEGK